jgi:hypothetical protein
MNMTHDLRERPHWFLDVCQADCPDLYRSETSFEPKATRLDGQVSIPSMESFFLFSTTSRPVL